MLPTHNPTETAAWRRLEVQFLSMQATTMRELFEEDPQRYSKMHLMFEDILVDYSKNLIIDETLKDLVALADEVGLRDAILDMFNGGKINQTERRSVLHIALRNRANTPILSDGEDVMPEVNRVLNQMKVFSDNLIQGKWKGFTGKSITDIVNIGIGGSDLGPYMVTEALKPLLANHNTTFRIQRRWYPHRRDGEEIKPGDNPFYYCFKNVYHARDHDEC